MTEPINPPSTDAETDRHRFYAQIASAYNNHAAAQERIFDVLMRIEDSINAQKEHNHGLATAKELEFHAGQLVDVRKDFDKLETQITTTGKNFKLVSGIVGFLLVAVLGAALGLFNRVDKLERTAEVYQLIFKPHEALPEKFDAMKNRINALEDQVGDHIWREKK